MSHPSSAEEQREENEANETTAKHLCDRLGIAAKLSQHSNTKGKNNRQTKNEEPRLSSPTLEDGAAGSECSSPVARENSAQAKNTAKKQYQ